MAVQRYKKPDGTWEVLQGGGASGGTSGGSNINEFRFEFNIDTFEITCSDEDKTHNAAMQELLYNQTAPIYYKGFPIIAAYADSNVAESTCYVCNMLTFQLVFSVKIDGSVSYVGIIFPYPIATTDMQENEEDELLFIRMGVIDTIISSGGVYIPEIRCIDREGAYCKVLSIDLNARFEEKSDLIAFNIFESNQLGQTRFYFNKTNGILYKIEELI